MADSEYVHHHYWPGEDLVPITPQARQFGYVFPVYVTRAVWNITIAWKQGKNTNPDTRIYELLKSAWDGMGKALTAEPDRVSYLFKHWYWHRHKPRAKKKSKMKVGARLLLDPETEEPWMLLFHPNVDGEEVIEYGEPEENRADDPESEVDEHADGAELGLRVREGGQHAPERPAEGSSDELEQSPGSSDELEQSPTGD